MTEPQKEDQAAVDEDVAVEEGAGAEASQPQTEGSTVAQSTYELLQQRLVDAAKELAGRAERLNELRLDTFGSSQLDLAGTERVRTENNVVPRDIAAAGNQLVMAYNATAGTRSEIRPEDVFSIHHLDDSSEKLVLSPNPDGLVNSALDDDQFRRDFEELHTYFQDARVQQVYETNQKLLVVFRTGDGVNDLRVLRWLIHPDGELSYMDDRGERDHRFPPHQNVEWQQTTRADHLENRVIVVEDRIHVNPLDGKLNVALTDGTPGGLVLVDDDVEESDQSLQDCIVDYALAGDLVILRILPYRETVRRHYVINLLARTATRVDALDQAFRLLPENQGLIFPEGIYLRTGEVRTFDLDADDMELLEVLRSPNGEDVLYVFHHKDNGRSILLPYNVVRQEVAVPIWCHGHCLFPDGTMLIFREEPQPTRIHPVQIWRTPFCSDEWFSEQPQTSSPLDRIGNASLVAGIADALALQRLVVRLEPSSELYGDLLGTAGRTLDTHHWFDAEEVGNLAQPVQDIRSIAEQVIEEFEQVQQVRASAREALGEARESLADVQQELRINPPESTEDFIDRLSSIRHEIGHLHTIKEVREIDISAVDTLIEEATEVRQTVAQDAASYLAQDDAFGSYVADLDELSEKNRNVTASIEVASILEDVDGVANSMDTVADAIGVLVVDDPQIRASVLEQVSSVLANLNRVRVEAQNNHDTLIQSETGALFATELGLFGQTISTTLARCDSPEACDDGLARLLLQLEQLETAGPRSETQLDELNERRDHLVEVFTSRRQQLLDDSQKRADQLTSAARRTLQRVADRSARLESIDDINGFFAADALIDRVRRIIEQLKDLGEPVRADELQASLGSSRDSAIRALRDRLELFDRGAVKLGQHRFSVDERQRELTLVPFEDHLDAVLTGTDLRMPVADESLAAHRALWDQAVPSETNEMYRSAYLAASIALDALEGDDAATEVLSNVGPADGDDDTSTIVSFVRDVTNDRIDEGYDQGVHDLDAARILAVIGPKALAAGSLLYAGSDRAAARWAWNFEFDDEKQSIWTQRGNAAAVLETDVATIAAMANELAEELKLTEAQSRYLMGELVTKDNLGFAISTSIQDHVASLRSNASVKKLIKELNHDADGIRPVLANFINRHTDLHVDDVEELAVLLLTPDLQSYVVDIDLSFEVPGLSGGHQTIEGRQLAGRIDSLFQMAQTHRRVVMPAHQEFNTARRGVIKSLRSDLRLDDLEPQVPEGFVRNKLIDKLYLPLIGDNLARQIGTADDQSAARSGLLMLLSPPGYGKTTLVEYIADRLGMALVKVSGPALGHEVTSLDPALAPSATAAREVERINMSFAVGSNVILYLDDIQHTSPELLQRFISLCDGQRRIDGVWNGEATTFDLRGKRYAIVMAGNPYTESGERFHIPDMLANRADIYNLGDVLSGNEDVFAHSYIENALTANAVLAMLAGRDRKDVDVFMAAVDGKPLDETRLSHTYSSAEQRDIVSVLGHLRRVQNVILSVNRQYIKSAATDEKYRTEPPFLLQGSYRNMARMATKLLPVMTPDEVNVIIDEHYVAESQALTGDAEANLLKLAELRDVMTPEQQDRWADILETFRRQQRLGGDERDPATRMVAAINEVASELSNIRNGVSGDEAAS